jgi:hypothetical protein
VIISASRRTDVPAFFGRWFMNRIREGWAETAHPFNSRHIKHCSLAPHDVDVIVFWSKNPLPLAEHLGELDERGYRYYFQFTLNDYPPALEPGVPSLAARLDTFRNLADGLGPGKVLWRYDPIIVSSVTPADYHLERVDRIASVLDGYTQRLTISFLDFYGKTAARLSRLSRKTGIAFMDITAPARCTELLPLARGIGDIARCHGLAVFSCAEAVELAGAGIHHGACIDAVFIREAFGIQVAGGKDRGQRPLCLCTGSIDVGAYRTCRHQCAYCYATPAGASVGSGHDPSSPMLNAARHPSALSPSI